MHNVKNDGLINLGRPTPGVSKCLSYYFGHLIQPKISRAITIHLLPVAKTGDPTIIDEDSSASSFNKGEELALFLRSWFPKTD